MTNKTTYIFLATLIFFTGIIKTAAQSDIKYGNDYIVFEAEDTNLNSNWTIRTPTDPDYLKYLTNLGSSPAPVNDTYLEYTGPWQGEGTELTYVFTAPKTGTYQLAMRMHSPLRDGELADQRNDFYIKMEGNFTSGSSKHSESDLRTFHKMFGRGANKWGTCINLEHNGNNGAFYNLTEGESYSFYLKGRSSTTVVDYITFYDTNYLAHDISNQGPDLALQLPEEIRPYVAPTAINFVNNITKIRVNTSLDLGIKTTPTNGNPSVVWSSSNTSIIAVNQTGTITALGNIGDKAIITATSTIDNSIIVANEIEVITFYTIPVTGITISPDKTVVIESSTEQLMATVNPIDADDKTVTWTSSNETIATVATDGTVTGISNGVVIIRATSNENATVFDEAEVEIGQFFAQSISFDDNSKYTSTNYYNNGNMEVSFNYHAGSLETIKSLKLYLREVDSSWKVVKDIVLDLTDSLSENNGSYTANISLTGITPTANLTEGNFYYLFIKNENTSGGNVTKGIRDIIVLDESELSTDEHFFNKNFTIYPIPADDYFIIESKTSIAEMNVDLYTITGRVVYTNFFTLTTNRIDTSLLNPGIYILKIKSKGLVVSKRILVK
ncbi:hypothetical protein FHR24_001246 [Wenyingzhuangia heitensis]|uniref:BIG2 domain-containing protein n=1 Tax=Wenyingzhuangia heitensis TaxID=1487859 RepID=A0ABX0UCM9_9FLAO|nr:Ig-like domain-containing protein [Wenyingzhuangia heitensis]NIJ44807.1 hypothetical protein [Wenyingzhuangia heitensis]